MAFVRKTKTDYYNNVDHKNVADNKKIGKHHFTEKSSTFNNIRIVKKDRILDRNEEVANTFYDFILKYFLN